MKSWKFHVLTFGCKVNQYESQSLREAWQTQGGQECDDPAAADVICINSCAITAHGERDARAAILRLRREAPQARIVLTGCAAHLVEHFAPAPHAARQGQLPQADAVVGQENKAALLDGRLVRGLTASSPDTPAAAGYPPFRIGGFRRARPVLKIQDGCEHRCTYCIVPLTRGRCRSRAPQEILDEARRLFRAGYAELMLSGINLRQYGRDCPDYGDFWQLLAWLDAALAPEFAGRARLRISSLEPGQLDSRGVDTLMACRLVCPHLHISLQHASYAVLRRMGRGHYHAERLQEAVRELSAHWPVMGLGADIILGFPGESEADVRCLLDFVAATPFSYAHVFPYSRRPGTAADRFADQIAPDVRQERARRVREAVATRQQAFRQAQLALPRFQVVADSPHADGTRASGKGVNDFYVPCLLPPSLARKTGLLTVRPVALEQTGLRVEAV